MLGSLPLHPLVVHFAVALLLATGVLQLAALAAPRVRRWLGWVLPALAVLTALVTKLAESAGEVLEHRVPPTAAIHEHAEWGERASALAFVLALASIAHWLATDDHPRAARWGRALRRRPVVLALTVVCALASVGVIATDVLAGHSGATAVWTP